MKKQVRKLWLSRETLSHLTGESLDGAAGGIFQKTNPQSTGSCPQSCTCTFTCPC
jgi:hypothetical protein